MKPPRMAEAVVGLLVPPACREHVLGDLHERCTSPQQYILDALRTVPSVILSQVRRTTDPPALLAEALGLYFSFLAAAWRLEGAAFFHDDGFLRLAIPSLAVLLAFVLGKAYATPGKQRPGLPFVQAALAVCFGFLSQAVLLAINSGLTLTPWTMLFGGGMSLLLLSWLQISFEPYKSNLQAAADRGHAPKAVDEIPERSRNFNKQLRRANSHLLLSVLFLVYLGWRTGTEQRGGRPWGGVILAAALYITYQVCKRNPAAADSADTSSSTFPAFYRSQLERRRDALRGIWYWYVLPFLGALMLFAWRIPLAYVDQRRLWPNIIPFTILALTWSFAMGKLSKREALKLKQEIDALDDAEDRPS